MSFMRQALEACTSCQSQQQVVSNHNTQEVQEDKSIENTDVTYNDGKGVKDIVIIDGPLSHSFTHALNVKFKKQPLQPTGTESPSPEQTQDEIAKQKAGEPKDPLLKQHSPEKIGLSTATESEQQDSIMEEFLIRELNRNSQEFSFIANRFDFVDHADLPVDVTCKTTVMSVSDFLKPSVLMDFDQDRTNSPVEHVVVVVSDALGRTSQTTNTSRFVSLESVSSFFENTEQELEFNAAVESHLKPNGYKVVVGIESYLDYLQQMSRNLSYRK